MGLGSTAPLDINHAWLLHTNRLPSRSEEDAVVSSAINQSCRASIVNNMHGLLLFGICIGTWITWQGLALLRSYREACSIGLPIILSPTRTLNPVWIVLGKATPILSVLQHLPLNLGNWARFTYIGWQYDDKGAIHQMLGPAFVLCTPGLNEVHLADPSAAHTVLTQRKDFIKPLMMYGQ